jgi:predicted DNA-binding protein (UPF0251 family)
MHSDDDEFTFRPETHRDELEHWQERNREPEPYRGTHWMTLEEAAKRVGVTKQHAHKLEQQALYKLWDAVWSDPELLAMWERTFK